MINSGGHVGTKAAICGVLTTVNVMLQSAATRNNKGFNEFTL